MASAVEMTSAVEEVTQLVLRERQCRDRGWWEEMADCFAADSVVDMSWFTGSGPEFVRESKRMAGGGWGGHSVHRLSPPAVRVEGDRALAELPLAIEFRIGIGGTEADLTSYARSQYRAQRAGGRWRIARITSIYERDTLLPTVPGPGWKSTRQSSPATGPLTGAWPGTWASAACGCGRIFWATTSPRPSPASTRPTSRGCVPH